MFTTVDLGITTARQLNEEFALFLKKREIDNTPVSIEDVGKRNGVNADLAKQYKEKLSDHRIGTSLAPKSNVPLPRQHRSAKPYLNEHALSKCDVTLF